jgi:hypothetical protein
VVLGSGELIHNLVVEVLSSSSAPSDRYVFHSWNQFSGKQIEDRGIVGNADHDFVDTKLAQSSDIIEDCSFQMAVMSNGSHKERGFLDVLVGTVECLTMPAQHLQFRSQIVETLWSGADRAADVRCRRCTRHDTAQYRGSLRISSLRTSCLWYASL